MSAATTIDGYCRKHKAYKCFSDAVVTAFVECAS